MKIIDRYLLLQFLKPLGVCTALFTVLVFVGHFFDKMTVFTAFHAHMQDIVVYLVLGIPYWLNVVYPVATLLALMYSLGPLQQRGEITAMRGAGIPAMRVFLPFIAMGVLISLVSLVGGATVFPALSSKANVIYRQRIKQEQSLDTLKDHIVAAGRNRQRFTIGTLDTQAGKMTDVVIDQFDDQMRHLSTLSAHEGRYHNSQWTFYQGSYVQFNNDGITQQESFQEKTLNINEKPEDFVYDDRKPDDLTYHELRKRISHFTELGIPSFKERVTLHLQYALPFANVMVIVLGIPFALNRMKGGTAHNLAYAFGATFLYWGAVSVFQSYGEHGYLAAWVAAWGANFIFGILAFWLLRRALQS